MSAHPLRRTVLAAAVVLATASLAAAALPPQDAAPPSESLAGQLLVADPSIGDPRFVRTVILVVIDDANGTVGIAINRPIGERSIAELLQDAGQDAAGVAGSVRVFAGGPLQPEAGFVVHSAEYRRRGTIAVDQHVAMTVSPDVLRDIGRGKGPKHSLFALGYAGWAPGQLRFELMRHDWIVVPDDMKLLFDADRATIWQRARARQAVPL